MTPEEMLAQQLMAQRQNGGGPPLNPWDAPPPATPPPPQPETAPLLQRLLEALGIGSAPAAPAIPAPTPTIDPNSPEGIAEALRKRNEGMSQFAPPSGSTGLP